MGPSRRTWLTHVGTAVLVGLASLAPAAAQVGPTDDADCDFGTSKGDLCGHARTAIARLEAAATARPSAEALLAQADTDITHCFLDIEVKTGTVPKSIAGSNTLDVTSLVNGLAQITLDLADNMIVDAVTVNGAAAVYSRPADQILVNLPSAHNVGQDFQVKVTYHGSPNDTDFFSSPHYFFTTHGGTDVVSTLSQPYYAYFWWPCKENWGDTATPMDDKFTLDMWVTVPGTMVVASNGAHQGTDALSGSRLRYRWKESYPIATYLVSFAATNYVKQTYAYSHAGGSMPVEFYIYPESVTESQPYLANIVQAIATYSGAYGQYPFITEKYGVAQFPWCCGMEHQTMTSQGAYTSERRNVHELSHQWWGDHVTCKTWHDVWLNEGIATFSEALWEERRPGGSYAAYLAHLNTRKPSTTATGTVYRYDISSSSAIFSTTYAYYKGGWVTHMLRHVLGDDVFFGAMADYRAAYGGGGADTEEFRGICESAAGLAPGSLNWFFNQWIYNPGAPYYRYGWEQEQIDGRTWVRLHVEQYQKTVASGFPNAMKMPIDVTLTTAGGSETQVIWNDAAGAGTTVREWFLLPAAGPVTAVQLDKDTWILRRDPVTSAAYIEGPPRLIDIVPAMGSTSGAVPGVSSVAIQFSEPITVNGSDFTVNGSRTGPQVFSFHYDAARYLATLTFTEPLAPGQNFTVQVADTVRSQAASAQLDGELADAANPGSLPSGDGLPGGAAAFVFAVGVTGDFNFDGFVDAQDVEHFVVCMTGAGQGLLLQECQDADLDRDLDADQSDFGILQRCLAGAQSPDPACG